LDVQFEIYKNIKKLVDPILTQFSQNESAFNNASTKLQKLFSAESPLANVKLYEFDSLLEGETEDSEEYITRNDSEENIENRRQRI